ncbi:YCF48-related protein [Pseudomonas sp. ABC1]|uniref:YCF48-related protein n=1 Tax=Pseudomonas sp. ABC1 TaxID=2748080 RepID=UPI00211A38B3|nr:YCF48-related protein [Pseudomonas sp. ABC1]
MLLLAFHRNVLALDIHPRYAIESSKAVSSLLLDIARAGDRLVAVGDRGHILYSDDDGQHWTQAKVPTRQMLTAVDFVDARHGWAVGHDASILASSDGGETWNLQFEDVEREAPLLDVWFEDIHHGIAIGAYGALLETRDGGQNWLDIDERLANEDGYHLNAIARVEGAGLFIAGEMGALFHSTDDGQSWTSIELPYEGSLFGVQSTGQPGELLVYGLRGNLLFSSDAGASWRSIVVTDEGAPFASGLSGANLLADGRIVVVGHAGSVLSSSDRGHTFSVIHRPDRRSLAGVVDTRAGELILVGQGGVRTAAASGLDRTQQ